MPQTISPGRRVLHRITGYYGIVLLTQTAPAGYFWVVFDGEDRIVEVRQSELMPL